MPSLEKIRAIFDLIGTGQTQAFFENVEEDVDWTVKGESELFHCPKKHILRICTYNSASLLTSQRRSGTYCPISGHYKSKQAFHEGTRALSSTWATPLSLVVQDIIHDGANKAAVELKAVGVECKDGMKFTNEYVWVCHFNDHDKIVKISAFMDT